MNPATLLFWLHILLPSPPSAAVNLLPAIGWACEDDENPRHCAALLTSIAYYESHFDLYARSGAKDAYRSYGAFQISERWLLLPSSPEMQAGLAAMLVRDSYRRCGDLTQYTSGQCGRGKEEAERREKLAERLEGIFVEEKKE